MRNLYVFSVEPSIITHNKNVLFHCVLLLLNQGRLTEGEVSVRLNTLYQLLFKLKLNFSFLQNTLY